MRPLSEVVEEEEEEARAKDVVDGGNVDLDGGGAYELCERDSGCELVCFSSSCRIRLSVPASLSSAWKVARASASSTNDDVLSCLSRCPQLACNSNVDPLPLLPPLAEAAASGGRRGCDSRLEGSRSRGRGTAMRLVVLSLFGGGDGKCALCVAASISRSFLSSSARFACNCSPAVVVACMRRAERVGPSLLPVRLLDLRCLSSALFRRLDSGEERLLRGGRNAPVGVVDIGRAGSGRDGD